MLWTAFVIGILGSFHCVGMCGPLVLALPGQSKGQRVRYLYGRLLYNSGRIITYGILGLTVGLVGKSISLAGYQQWLSISAGIFILLIMLLPGSKQYLVPRLGFLMRITNGVKRQLSKLFKRDGLLALFIFGLLNGLLPCGLVYLALAGALAVGSITGSFSYMVLFGLGTVPLLLLLSFLGQFISQQWRHRMYKMVPVFMIFLAVLFILRGLNLGIPYISPQLQNPLIDDPSVICH